MSIDKKAGLVGIFAFLLVLFTMPLGHAFMILTEHYLADYLFLAAFGMGFIGLILLLFGIITKKDSYATILGLLGGLLIWTGWIEFAYVYYAQRYGIQPLIENGEIVTKPEYLLMPSSIGFWMMFMIYYMVGTRSACNFFNWFQKRLGNIGDFKPAQPSKRNVAVVTFMELMLLLWTSYLVLLFAYDKQFFGDEGYLTKFIAFGSLAWSIYLFGQLLRKKQMGHAIRYAIPVVIIFWTFVEVMGRWNILEEIWVSPLEYWLEMTITLVLFVAMIVFIWLQPEKKKKATNRENRD